MQLFIQETEGTGNMITSKKIKDWIYWQTPFGLLILTLGLMALGVRYNNYYIFYSCFIPFTFIFVWIFHGIKSNSKKLKEENKKHKGMYIKCKDCQKYVDVVSVKAISTYKKYNLVDRVEMIYSCGHKKNFSIQ